jgi:hypothetical protein
MRPGFCLSLALGTFGLALALAGRPAVADDLSLTLKDHHFTPAEITVPANKRTTLHVRNADTTPAEFESDDFKAEKVVPAGREVIVNIPALKPGTYEFHDEYHEADSKSRLIAK